MMTKYRKLPIEIEAWHWTPPRFEERMPEWILDGLDDKSIQRHMPGDDGPMQLTISTLEGVMTATAGDWIIRGVNGEIYPCKPDIFAKTYEPVDTPEAVLNSMVDAMYAGVGALEIKHVPTAEMLPQGLRVCADGRNPPESYPDPTPEMLKGNVLFEAIWQAIKGWDLSRHHGAGYAGATGNDARRIYDHIVKAITGNAPEPEFMMVDGLPRDDRGVGNYQTDGGQ